MELVKVAIGLVVLVLVTSVRDAQAAPIASDASSVYTVELQRLRSIAETQVFNTLREILALEGDMNEKFNLFHQNCYVRFQPTNDADINTIKDDVTSLTQLLPVIQQLAENETSEIIKNRYNIIIKLMKNSIVAMNNLIKASGGIETTAATTVDQKCEQLDKLVKLSALKLQVQLTSQDLQLLTIN